MKTKASSLIQSLTLAFLLSIPGIAAAEPGDKSPLVGMWQSPQNGGVLQFLEDGTVSYEGAQDEAMKGKWKLAGEGDEKTLTMKIGDEPESRDLRFVIDQEGKRLLIAEGDSIDFEGILVEKKPDPSKLVGRWKEIYKEDFLEEYYLTIRREDGSGFAIELYIDHEKKSYARDDYSFKWKVLGEMFVHVGTSEDGDIESLYGSVSAEPEKLSFKFAGELAEEDEEMIVETRTEDLDHPKPPKGYKMVDVDSFWEFEEE